MLSKALSGISGYHMVKALASAPERWSKIYSLSRRPPPDYFFDGNEDTAPTSMLSRIITGQGWARVLNESNTFKRILLPNPKR